MSDGADEEFDKRVEQAEAQAKVAPSHLRLASENATPEPATPGGEAAKIMELAALDRIDYDRCRKAEASMLGIRTTTLDAAVRNVRPAPESVRERMVSLVDLDPWPAPVATADLLNELVRALRRHVIMAAAAMDATAAWILHSWVHHRFHHTPRLAITSPAKRCGKSTLLDVLQITCRRPLKADNVSAAAVFRTVEALAPLTLLVDEADSFLTSSEELRGVLNSGFARDGAVIRVAEIDGEQQPVCFATFAPVALASIGALPDTLADRAVPIALQRKAAGETVQRLRAPGARTALRDLACRCARWAADHTDDLNPDPTIPEAFGDREGDIAVPLLSIADHGGGEWPARIRSAVAALFGKRSAAEGTADAGALLLADLRGLFLSTGTTRMTSMEIVQHLGRMEERPWPEWQRGQPMTAPQLARALAPFGIRPGTIRVGRHTAKGYYIDTFAEAWGRYLHSAAPSVAGQGVFEPAHRHNRGKSEETANFQAVTSTLDVTDENPSKPAEKPGCNGVTDESRPSGGEEDFETDQGGWEGVL
jgi:putative DNA primase/helicase